MIFSPMGLLGGASGALCGLIAAEAVWMVLNRAYLPGPLFSAWMRNMVMNTILIVIISMLPQVSASAHIGGAAVGAIAAVLLHYQRYGQGVTRWLALLAIPLVPVASIGALLQAMKTQPQWVQLRGMFQADQERLHAETTREERRNLRERYQAEATGADNAARKAYENAWPLLNKGPERRGDAERQQAIEALAQAHANLTGATERLSENAPWRSQEVREAHLGILAYLQALADLCSISEEYLRDNRKIASYKPFEDQVEAVRSLQNRWASYIGDRR
jgi:hypothetical protein